MAGYNFWIYKKINQSMRAQYNLNEDDIVIYQEVVFMSHNNHMFIDLHDKTDLKLLIQIWYFQQGYNRTILWVIEITWINQIKKNRQQQKDKVHWNYK